jgi:hypothetical protein
MIETAILAVLLLVGFAGALVFYVRYDSKDDQ